LPDKPGAGILYVAPSPARPTARRQGRRHVRNGRPHCPRIEGDNEAGLAHRLTQQWEMAGISLQGMTLCVLGSNSSATSLSTLSATPTALPKSSPISARTAAREMTQMYL